MSYVRSIEGVHVAGCDQQNPAPGKLTAEEAEASAQERNARAEVLGIKTRYEAVHE